MGTQFITNAPSLVSAMTIVFLLSGTLGCSEDNERSLCSAVPSCLPGHDQIESAADCPEGVECYESALCDQSIWCATDSSANCTAEPTCQSGHQQVSSQEECQDRPICYYSSLCGETIWCSDETSSGPCDGSCTPGEVCEIPPPEGMEIRNIGCICTTSGLYVCDTDMDFNQATIPCGDLTCGPNEYCAHVCDCCGILIDGAVESSHEECRPCDGDACPYQRVASIPCA